MNFHKNNHQGFSRIFHNSHIATKNIKIRFFVCFRSFWNEFRSLSCDKNEIHLRVNSKCKLTSNPWIDSKSMQSLVDLFILSTTSIAFIIEQISSLSPITFVYLSRFSSNNLYLDKRCTGFISISVSDNLYSLYFRISCTRTNQTDYYFASYSRAPVHAVTILHRSRLCSRCVYIRWCVYSGKTECSTWKIYVPARLTVVPFSKRWRHILSAHCKRYCGNNKH